VLFETGRAAGKKNKGVTMNANETAMKLKAQSLRNDYRKARNLFIKKAALYGLDGNAMAFDIEMGRLPIDYIKHALRNAASTMMIFRRKMLETCKAKETVD
jgi:hypothetical protein